MSVYNKMSMMAKNTRNMDNSFLLQAIFHSHSTLMEHSYSVLQLSLFGLFG